MKWFAKALGSIGIRMWKTPYTWSSASAMYRNIGAQHDPRLSSVVMACTEWIIRTAFSETIQQETSDHSSQREPSTNDLNHLLQVSSEDIRMALIDYLLCGNGWLLKRRNGNMQRVSKLTWIPAEFVSCPAHNVWAIQIHGGDQVSWDDVVHLSWGMSASDPRLGYNPLAALAYEIDADIEAAQAGLSTARNLGRPGLVMAPKDGSQIIPAEALDNIRNDIYEQYSGSNRGMPLVMNSPTEVFAYPAAADDGQLSALRQVAEERVASVYGIPAAVVGFGTGMQQTKVGATMSELRRQAYLECVLPLQQRTAKMLGDQLLPDFEPKVEEWKLEWPVTKALVVLVDERQEQAARLVSLVHAGILSTDEAREELGFESMGSGQQEDISASSEEDTDGDSDNIKSLPVKYHEHQNERNLKRALNNVRDEMTPEWQRDTSDIYRRFGSYVSGLSSTWAADILDDAIKVAVLEDWLTTEAMPIWETLASRVTTKTMQALAKSSVELDFMLPDPVQQQIYQNHGRRLGLLDLPKTTKEYVFRAIEVAREEGLGASDIATRIADSVSRGRFASPEDRALVIARTETMHAQNVATMAAYENTDGVIALRAVDDQIGFGDPHCVERNGKVFSFAEAKIEAADEHPSGTLSFLPVTDSEQLPDRLRT